MTCYPCCIKGKLRHREAMAGSLPRKLGGRACELAQVTHHPQKSGSRAFARASLGNVLQRRAERTAFWNGGRGMLLRCLRGLRLPPHLSATFLPSDLCFLCLLLTTPYLETFLACVQARAVLCSQATRQPGTLSLPRPAWGLFAARTCKKAFR